MLKRILATVLVLSFLAIPLISMGDTLTLNDGTVLEGTVIDQGDTYWIKTVDGSKKILKKDVAKYTKGGVAPKPVAGTPSPTGSGGTSGTVKPAPAGAKFAEAKRKAEMVDAPVMAVQIWEKFLEADPAPGDVDNAKAELEKWKKLDKDKAERIKGKWVGGKEREELLKQVKQLLKEANEAEKGSQMVIAVQKMEKAVALYPNSYQAHFSLGYYNLIQGVNMGAGALQKYDSAIKSLETAVKINPKSPEALSDLAIAYNFRDKYELAVVTAYKAVEIEDSKELVQNLISCIMRAPPGMRENNSKIRPIVAQATLLATKYGFDGKSGFTYLYPGFLDAKRRAEGKAPVEAAPDKRPGPVWSGSGFFISPDGYFLTNRHVATGEPEGEIQPDLSFRVKMDDGTEQPAELIGIDKKYDIAMMKIKPKGTLPYFHIVDRNPNPAADALVLGYPATSMDGSEEMSMQVAKGAVKSINTGDMHEVWFDLSTTHGNSGGPIVDRNGDIIGILTGGREVYNVVYVLGIGPMQMQGFLKDLGEKAPKVEYVHRDKNKDFNGEQLTIDCRKPTLFVMAIRGVPDAGDKAAGDKDKKPGDKDKDKDKDKDGGAAAGGDKPAE